MSSIFTFPRIACFALLLATACGDDTTTSADPIVPDAAEPPVVVPDAAPACVRCSAIASGQLDIANLCPESQAILLAAFSCLCGAPGDPTGGACAAECGASVCAAGQLSTECGACAASACAAETTACLGDT